VDFAANRIDLQKLPELLRQIRFHCYTLFLPCNGPRNRGSSSEHAFFVRPLGIAPEDRAPAQIISAFVGLLTREERICAGIEKVSTENNGYLQADAYRGYDAMFKNRKLGNATIPTSHSH
jgi:hypothetical protein